DDRREAAGIYYAGAYAHAAAAQTAWLAESSVGRGVLAWSAPDEVVEAASYAVAVEIADGLGDDGVIDQEQAREKRQQCKLLRDIIGNPLRSLSSRFFPAHVLGLAETCFAAFPLISADYLILADA